MADPKLKLGNDIWATKQKSLLAYNDEGGNFKSLPFQVDRISGGSYVGRNGLIQSAASNEPRIDFLNNTKGGLLLEPQRTNLLTYSELFDNSYWIKENSSIGTGIVSPMGDNDAQNVIEDTSTNRHRIRALVSVTSGTTYTFSVWAKSTNRNLVINADVLFNARSGFNLSTGVVADTTSGTATITAFPNDWFLCTVTGAATSTQSQVFYLQAQTGTTDANYTGDGSSTLSLFGAQLEAGNTISSYIPTSSAAVTRVQDEVFNGGNQYIFNDSEGTLFFDLQNFSGNTREITLSNGTSSNRIVIIFYGASAVIRFYVANGGVAQADSVFNLSFTFDQRNKIAFRYKQNDFKAYINGTQVFSDTSGNTPVGLSRFDFANSNGTSNFIEGEIYQTKIYNEALSDSELATLTTI